MPQFIADLPLWAQIALLALFLLSVALGNGWYYERLDGKHSEEQCARLVEACERAANIRDQWIAEAARLKGENEELALCKAKIGRVAEFVKSRQLTLRPVKGSRFCAFNEAELVKVMNGEEIN